MINASYLKDYKLMSAGAAVPLRCLKGYTPSSPFTCAYVRPYVAKYSAFPRCQTNNCTKPPVLDNGVVDCSRSGILAKPVQVCVLQNVSNTSNLTTKVCSMKHSSVMHNETCTLSCADGFFRFPNVSSANVTNPKWAFSCDLGVVRWSSQNVSSHVCNTTTTTTTTSFVNLTVIPNVTTTFAIPTFAPAPPGQMRTFSVKGSLVLSLALADNVTAKDLVENEAFVSSLTESLAAGLGIEASTVNVTSIELVDAPNQTNPGNQTKSGNASARRLINKKAARRLVSNKQLNVEYTVIVQDESAANQIVAQLSDETSKAAFQTAFVADLKMRVAASGIQGLEVTGVTVAVPTKESELLVIPNVTTTTTADPLAGYDAFSTGQPANVGVTDGDGINWGAVVGGLIGAGVGTVILCYLNYWYKAKQLREGQQE